MGEATPPSNNRDKGIIDSAALQFNSGDIPGALAILVAMEMMENNQNSIFATLGWTRTKCESLVLGDSILEQAVHDCIENKSLYPLREYS